MTGAEPHVTRSERRRWWLLFALVALAASAWSLGAPLMTGHDEAGQAVRSAALVRGELLGEPVPGWRNTLVTVRAPKAYRDAAAAGDCFLGRPFDEFPGLTPRPAGRGDCPSLDGGNRLVEVQTNQHRNPPLYPLVLGLPTLLSPDQPGAYLMRLVGVAICAALLASGLVTVGRFRARRLVALAALVVVTPEVVYVAGTSNTAGLELAASFALWMSALALAVGPAEPDARLVRRAGVALVALAVARPLAPAFAVAAVVVAALLASPERRRALRVRRDVWLWLAAGAVAAATTAAWLIDLRRRLPTGATVGSGLADAVGLLPWWLRGMVGVFGSTDVIPPAGLHLAWGAVAAVVLAWSLARAPGRAAAVAAVLAAGGLVLLVTGQGLSVPDTGVWWQGRYVLPLLMGAVLTPAGAARPRAGGHRAEAPGRGGPLLLGTLVALQAWAFLYAVRHYAVGYGGTANPLRYLLHPDWTPPYGPALGWAALFTAALAGTATVVWRSAVTVAPPVSAAAAATPVAVPAGAGD
jgi:hypothetical protein